MESSQRDAKPAIIKRIRIPYQPSQVSLSDLDAEGRLIPRNICEDIDKVILQNFDNLRKYGVDPITGGKLSKKLLNKEFGINANFSLVIARHNNLLKAFAIYRGEKQHKHLGKGARGVVKIVQDIHSGIFYAAKYQTNKNQMTGISNAFLHEATQLHIVGQLIASTSFTSSNRPDNRTDVLIMPLFAGLESRLLIRQKLSALQIMNLCCAASEAVQDIHHRGVIHRDLKTENIIYDLVKNQAGIIDFGDAAQADANLTLTANNIHGTPPYMPPEIFSHYVAWKHDINHHAPIAYSDKSDIYCLGLAFARLFKIVKMVNDAGITRCIMLDPTHDAATIAGNTVIQDASCRDKIVRFLCRMASTEPQERPDIEEVKRFFYSMRDAVRNQSCNSVSCAVIDLDIFEKLPNNTKRKCIDELLPYDAVQLISCKKMPDIPTMTRVYSTLSSYGLVVRDNLIYQATSLDHVERELKKHANTENIPSSYQLIRADRLKNSDNNVTKVISPPPEIDIQDLGPDNCLISAKMIYDIKRVLADEMAKLSINIAIRISKSEMISKYGIRCPYSIVMHRDEKGNPGLFAIYRGANSNKQLGAGQHGTVKLIQNLQTTEFHALKLTPAFANEDHLLRAAGGLIAKYSYEPQSNRNRKKYAPRHGSAPPTIDAMIMPLAKGRSVKDFTPKNFMQLHQLLLGMISATKQLHDKHILHNDLKPDQFIFDEETNIVKLIDLGMAINFNDKAVQTRLRGKSFRYGTNTYSYNHKPHVDVTENTPHQSLLKLDIYALGISLAQVSGLVDRHYNLVDIKSKTFQENRIISNKALRKQLWLLIQRMTQEDRDCRPDIDEVLKACKRLLVKGQRSHESISKFVSSFFNRRKPGNDVTFNDGQDKPLGAGKGRS